MVLQVETREPCESMLVGIFKSGHGTAIFHAERRHRESIKKMRFFCFNHDIRNLINETFFLSIVVHR